MLNKISKIFLIFITLHLIILNAQDRSGISVWTLDTEGNGIEGCYLYWAEVDSGWKIIGETDQMGYYRLDPLPAKIIKLKLKKMGMKETIVSLSDTLIKKRQIIVYLEKSRDPEFSLPPITVFSDRVKEQKLVENTISNVQLRNTPSPVEFDLFRVLQHIPGIVILSDYQTRPNVMGGEIDENLISIDDIPVYQPYHIGGIMSLFNVDPIENVHVITGGFPTKYDGRLSSIINIETKDHSDHAIEGAVSIGMFTSRFFVNGSIKNQYYLFSGRKTQYDILGANIMPYSFNDLLGKMKFNLSPNINLEILRMNTKDIIHPNDDNKIDYEIPVPLNWENHLSGLSLSGLFKKRNMLQVEYFISENNLELESWERDRLTDTVFIDNNLYDQTMRITWYSSFGSHFFQAGYEQKKIHLKYFWNLQLGWVYYNSLYKKSNGDYTQLGFADNFFDKAPGNYILDDIISYRSFFYQHRTQSKYFKFSEGLRVNLYGKRLYFSPRFSLQLKKNNLGINFYYDRMHQFITVPKEFRYTFHFYDLYLKAPKPMWSDLFSVNTEFIKKGYTLTAHAYYKKTRNIIKSVSRKPDFILGKADAKGIILRLKSNRYRLPFDMSFQLSEVNHQFGKDRYHPAHDIRFVTKGVLYWILPKNKILSLRVLFGSGPWFTPTIGKGEVMGGVNYLYGKINSRRYPPYQRIDIFASKKWEKKYLSYELFFSIINLFNNRNVIDFSLENRSDWDEINNINFEYTKIEKIKSLPIFPSIGFSIHF